MEIQKSRINGDEVRFFFFFFKFLGLLCTLQDKCAGVDLSISHGQGLFGRVCVRSLKTRVSYKVLVLFGWFS